MRRSPLSARPARCTRGLRVICRSWPTTGSPTEKSSMKPSSLSRRAISTFILEAGTATVRWLAAFALRTRVSMSAMVSLVMSVLRLPGRLLDAGHLPDAGVVAEADAAHAELAHEGARPAADAAAMVLLHLELGGSQRLRDQGFLSQLVSVSPHHAVSRLGRDVRWLLSCCLLPRLAEGHVEVAEQGPAFVVGLRGADDADLHAANPVDLVVVDLGKDELLAKPEGVVAVAVERPRVDAAEVADAGQGDVDQLVEELVHAAAAQGHLDPDGHALAQLERRHRLTRPDDAGRLAGAGLEAVAGGVDGAAVLDGRGPPDVQGELLQPGHPVRGGVRGLLAQGRAHVVQVLLVEPRLGARQWR